MFSGSAVTMLASTVLAPVTLGDVIGEPTLRLCPFLLIEATRFVDTALFLETFVLKVGELLAETPLACMSSYPARLAVFRPMENFLCV